MNRPNPPSILTSICLSVASDLSDTLRNRTFYLVLFLVPAGVAVMGAISWWAGRVVGDPSPETVLVVAADAGLRRDLEARLEGLESSYEVVPGLPKDADVRLESGTLDAIVELAPDFRETANLTARAARGTTLPEIFAAPVRDAWMEMRASAVGGPIPELRIEEFVQRNSEATDGDTDDSVDEVRKGVGSLLLLIGAAMSLGLAGQLIDSTKNRFNLVLSIGTPRLAIFVADTISVALTQSMHYLGWAIVVWMLVQGVGVALPFAMPPGEVLLRDTPVLVGLSGLMLLQGLGVSVIFVKVLADVPERVRTTLSSTIGIAVYLLLPRLFDGLVTNSSEGFFAMPLFGLWQMWTAYLTDGISWPSLPVQLVWAALSVTMGAWAFGFDEAPQSYVRRRWSARRSAVRHPVG